MRRALLTSAGTTAAVPMNLIPAVSTATVSSSGALAGNHRSLEFTPTQNLTVLAGQIRASTSGTAHISVWRISDATKLGGVDVTATAGTVSSAPLSLSLVSGVAYLVDAWGVTAMDYCFNSAAGVTSPRATIGAARFANGTGRDVMPAGTTGSGGSAYYGFVGLSVAT